MFLFSRRIETYTYFLTSECQVENLTSGQSNTMIDKLTLTPDVGPAVTSHCIFYTREVEFTKYSKYGISYAPDTELAQDKVNRPFGS